MTRLLLSEKVSFSQKETANTADTHKSVRLTHQTQENIKRTTFVYVPYVQGTNVIFQIILMSIISHSLKLSYRRKRDSLQVCTKKVKEQYTV